MKKLLTIFILCIGFNTFAQEPFINFFSEDGHKFWIVVEGQKINSKPKYRVDSVKIQNDWAKIKIIFENPDLPLIDKTVMYYQDENGKKGSVTYNIKQKNNGKWIVRACSWEQGDPNQDFVFQNTTNNNTTIISPNPNNTNTNTTTTTTTTTTITGVNVVVNDQSLNMNVKIDETDIDGRDKNVIAPPPANNTSAKKAMTDADFNNAKTTISNKSFEQDRLTLAKQIINANYFTTAQVVQIIKMMSFEDSRLDIAKTAYLRTIDKNNYYMVNDSFSFSSSIDDLNDYINSME